MSRMLACMTSPLLSTPSLRHITTPLLILYPSKSKLSHAHMEICKGSHIPADKRVKKVKRELIVCLCALFSFNSVGQGGWWIKSNLFSRAVFIFFFIQHPPKTHSLTNLCIRYTSQSYSRWAGRPPAHSHSERHIFKL